VIAHVVGLGGRGANKRNNAKARERKQAFHFIPTIENNDFPETPTTGLLRYLSDAGVSVMAAFDYREDVSLEGINMEKWDEGAKWSKP
jgi:hypothetical protein